MDSLRYWVTEMHVDGFRFDLASTLAREFYDVDRLSTFFELVQQDPVVSQVKLIAEPWDVGPGGYQVGGFPPQWTEWNGAYRDTVRDFWRGEPSLGEFASRMSGSSDLYEHSGRRPFASINFVTAHDGFTLRDLVSYNEKHNEANGEDNNDGESHNRSWNHGVEGPTDDPEILAAPGPGAAQLPGHPAAQPGRADALHGDELGRTQQGNNNTYAQDSEISWVHWDEADQPLVEFTAAVARLRKEHPTFRRKRFFTGGTVRVADGGDGDRLNDIVWLHLDGRPMEEADWQGKAQAIGMYLNGHGIAGPDARGQQIVDDHFLLYFNADGPAEVTLPPEEYAAAWDVVIDTGGSADDDAPHEAGSTFTHGDPQRRGAQAVHRARGRARRLGRRLGRRAVEEEAVTRAPVSTYRLQVTAEFDLFEAARRLPYLHDLGVDWVYLSPLLEAEAGQQPRVRRRRPRPDRPGARRRRRGSPRSRPRPAGSGWACSSTSCRTTSASRPRARTPGGGTCSGTAATPSTPPRSTSTGTPAAAGSGSRWSATTTGTPTPAGRPPRGRRRRAPLPRPPVPARARLGRRRRGPEHRPRPPALRARALEGRRPRPQLPALLRRQHAGRGSGSRTRRCSTDSHVEIRRWFDEGLVDGLRVDHPDGLRDPRGYLDDLAAITGGAYVLVEKILEPGERLSASWATAGTTGYDALGAGRPRAHRPGGPLGPGRARDPAARRRPSTGTS